MYLAVNAEPTVLLLPSRSSLNCELFIQRRSEQHPVVRPPCHRQPDLPETIAVDFALF
jgi:hypothetical protein